MKLSLIILFYGILIPSLLVAELEIANDSSVDNTAVQHIVEKTPIELRIINIEKKICSKVSESELKSLSFQLSDLKYEKARRNIANQQLALIEQQNKELIKNEQPSFRKTVVIKSLLYQFELLAVELLNESDRRKAIMMHEKLISQLDQNNTTPAVKKVINTATSVKGLTIAEVKSEFEQVIRIVKNEDLTLLQNAKPNKLISKAIKDIIYYMSQGPKNLANFTIEESSDWDKTKAQMIKHISILKQRQVIKYSLWAEMMYREIYSSKDDVIISYSLLSTINTELVIEPSLRKEIFTLLSELYKGALAQKKMMIRFKAISIARRTLSEF